MTQKCETGCKHEIEIEESREYENTYVVDEETGKYKLSTSFENKWWLKKGFHGTMHQVRRGMGRVEHEKLV